MIKISAYFAARNRCLRFSIAAWVQESVIPVVLDI